jgi:hypothetical protein
MATVQADGVTATSGSTTRNDRGVVRHGGTIGHSRLVAKTLGDTREAQTGSRVPGPNTAGIDIGNPSGNFAKMLVGKYIIRKVTDEIAGISNKVLFSGGSDGGAIGRKSIHNFKLAFGTRRLSTAIRANKWNEATGTWDSGFPTTDTDTFGSDHVATVSRSAPGEFTYRNGAKLPILDDYEAKTG